MCAIKYNINNFQNHICNLVLEGFCIGNIMEIVEKKSINKKVFQKQFKCTIM